MSLGFFSFIGLLLFPWTTSQLSRYCVVFTALIATSLSSIWLMTVLNFTVLCGSSAPLVTAICSKVEAASCGSGVGGGVARLHAKPSKPA